MYAAASSRRRAAAPFYKPAVRAPRRGRAARWRAQSGAAASIRFPPALATRSGLNRRIVLTVHVSWPHVAWSPCVSCFPMGCLHRFGTLREPRRNLRAAEPSQSFAGNHAHHYFKPELLVCRLKLWRSARLSSERGRFRRALRAAMRLAAPARRSALRIPQSAAPPGARPKGPQPRAALAEAIARPI